MISCATVAPPGEELLFAWVFLPDRNVGCTFGRAGFPAKPALGCSGFVFDVNHVATITRQRRKEGYRLGMHQPCVLEMPSRS